MKRILVTGATCPSGAAICRELIQAGYAVVGLGRRKQAFPTLPAGLFHPLVGDFTQPGVAENAVQGCEAVIHVGALSSPWAAKKSLHAINVIGTQRLVQAAVAAHVRRFVLISSASVTFTGTDALNVCEDAPYPDRWLCPYSASKAAAEKVVRTCTDLETVILRPRAIYGPGDQTLLPRLIARARKGKLRQLGRREVQQSLTYVDNLAYASVLALSGPALRTYHVADAQPVALWSTIAELITMLKLPPLGRPVPRQVVQALAWALENVHAMLPFLGEPNLTRYTAALLTHDQTLSLAAISTELGYQPPISGSEGLRRTAAAWPAS